jgi:glycosyltransferase involved in cell wall biosynthesis
MDHSARPLRVLQVNSLFSGGGADNQTLELARGLAEAGDEVILAVASGSRWESLARQAGLEVETFAARSPLKLAMIRSLVRILRARRIDIIHLHQGRDYWPGILAARLAARGARVVVTRHLMTRPRALSRWLLLSFADLVAVSKAVLAVQQRELLGPAARRHLIYGGIDTRRFQTVSPATIQKLRSELGWAPDQVVFGVVGACNLPRGKGQIELLEAADQLQTAFPQARFAVVGEGTLLPWLRDRAAALGLRAKVRFVPFTDEVEAVMGALDVLVHPAVGTEALGLVIWEAMAAGKPVIASRLDGIPEAFEEGRHGFLVPPGDSVALGLAMRRLLENPELRRRFGEEGRAHVERNFSRLEQARRMRALYLKLCGPD